MGELLIELLSEEIPARMQRRAIADFAALLRDKLAAAEISAGTLESYVTPRRLAVIAGGIPDRQPDRREERRGPRVGAPQKAIDGFLRSAGIASLADCEIRDTGRGEFYFAVIERPGRDAAKVLPELVQAAIAELPWPKSMRFPAAPLRWVRPLASVICLFDGAVLPLSLGEVSAGRTTYGHRFLSPQAIPVESARDYRDRLRAAHVILDREERKRIIAAGLDEKAAEARVAALPDIGLLEEVAGLVEYPVVLRGAIDPDFMSLPPEVLATAMRTHQKYFSCRFPDGKPAPFFLFVANNQPPDGGRAITAGNERVLRARLADARFFWDHDRKIRLEDRVEALKGRVYHEKLGSVYDKVERMEKIAWAIGGQIRIPDPGIPVTGIGLYEPQIRDRAERAAHLAKADLSTGMVGEFPELQGVMGRYYALYPINDCDRKDPRVAQAIAEHYKPLGPGDTCPTAPESIIVALADKIEMLVGFFAIGEKPTGSSDPYALRRAALGIIRLILENELQLGLNNAFEYASSLFRQSNFGLRNLKPELFGFIIERLKVHLREQGLRHDWIAAVLKPAVPGARDDDIAQLVARAQALKKFLSWSDGANLVIAYRRASNIVDIEQNKDQKSYAGPIDSGLLKQQEERQLMLCLSEVEKIPRTSLANSDSFTRAMTELATLRRPIDEFFDKVTVNTDDPALRENRLRLLSRIRDTMNQIADFSQIEG